MLWCFKVCGEDHYVEARGLDDAVIAACDQLECGHADIEQITLITEGKVIRP